MYSLMSTRTTCFSSSKSSLATTLLSSVLPTPVGPKKSAEHTGCFRLPHDVNHFTSAHAHSLRTALAARAAGAAEADACMETSTQQGKQAGTQGPHARRPALMASTRRQQGRNTRRQQGRSPARYPETTQAHHTSRRRHVTAEWRWRCLSRPRAARPRACAAARRATRGGCDPTGPAVREGSQC